LILQKKEEYTK
jgi:hypothetical protein